jgi:soluble lytic murein transglycosylase-like protein
MDGRKLITLGLLGVAAAIAYQYYVQSTVGDSDSETDADTDATTGSLTDTLQTLYESAMNTIIPGSWMTQGLGPTYVPYFNQVEAQLGIPTNLLARIGYQESHFREDIISGAVTSSAGAIGIMQLMPQYFPGAGQNPQTDIATAGQYLESLYTQFGDWQVAVAAYNDGPGNMNAILNGTKTMPLETQNYVADIFADVPVQGSLVQVA